jgi:hypothetical protein
MAKKRIHNYVFLPGTALSSNAYPDAYELLVNNKEFIQAESETFIANSITIDQAINLNPNAVTLLTNNKTFLQDEVVAYIQYNINNNIGPFIGYTYDASKCRRDTGYVIDAYIYDLRYGGNEKIRSVAEQYWIAGTPQVDGDRQPEIWAHSKLRDIITKNIFLKISYISQQSPVTSTQNTSGSVAETHAQQRIASEAEILLDVITNGLSVLQGVSNNPNAVSLLTRNTEFLKDEVTAWIGRQVDIASSYTPTNAIYTPATGAMTLTIGTHDLQADDVIFIDANSLSFTCALDGNSSVKTYPRSSGVPNITGTDPAYNSPVVITSTTSNSITVNVGISSDTSTHTFISAVADSISSGFTSFTYDKLKCKRDVGFIIDAYIRDLKNGGSEGIREAMQQYFLNGVPQVDGDRLPEIAAHRHLKNLILNYIFLRISVTSLQDPVVTQQDTSGSAPESGTSSRITELHGIVDDVFKGGLAALAAVNVRPNAVTALTNNIEFLKDEITAWIAFQVANSISPFAGYTYDAIKCKRDVGYIIEGYIYDLRYGGVEGTRDNIQQYWIGTTAQVDGDRSPEVAAHTQLRTIINNFIFPKVAYASQQSPVTSTQNTSHSTVESDADDQIISLSGIVTSVITNGLNSLPLATISQSFRNFAGYIYDTSKCARDLGYVLDAYAHDLRYGGNIQTRFVASRYWEGQIPQVDGDRRPEIVTHQFIRDLINFFIFSQESYTPLQGTVSIYTNNAIAYDPVAASRIYELSFIILNVIKNGLLSLPARENGVTQIKLQGKYRQDEILLITNATTNNVLYNFASPDYGASISYFETYNSNGFLRDDDFPAFLNVADYVTTISLDYDTSARPDTDDIQVFIEDSVMTIRPWDFGTDAIERMRVATPQSMLDADFEYGLQPTKWQAIGLLRGYPSVYEIPGSDTSVLSVVTDASTGTSGIGASLITVTTAAAHGFIVSSPFTIKALANTITGFSRAEGTFLVNSVPTATTFTYYATSKVGTSNGQVLATTYTQLRKAAFYTGANVGSPNFSVFSNGTSGTITSVFATTTGSDQIAFSGTAPGSGSPISGTGINPGTQISSVIGSGGIVVTSTIANNISAGSTTFNVTNATGIVEGLGIDNGSGTAIFVNGITGTTVSLTGPITNNRIGGTGSYNAVSGTTVAPIGSGAIFTIERLNNTYGNLTIDNGGSNYQQGDQIKISGVDLGGTSPANDAVITVAAAPGGVIGSATITSGTSIVVTNSYTGVLQDATNGIGSSATFNISYSGNPGGYTVVLVNPGSNYVGTEQLTILGTSIGGTSPANDLTITVDTTGGLGEILTFTTTGTSVGTNTTFVGLIGINQPNSGTSATFNITRDGLIYDTVSVNAGGTNYRIGNTIIIPGSSLDGSSPTNDLTLTVVTVSGTAITGVTSSGTAVSAGSISFYSAIALSEITVSTVPDSTTITYSGIATIEVTFSSAHGLIPGASITCAINSAGSNHNLAAGPFFVETVPATNSIRYTARTSGTIDTTTALTGIVYTRSDTYFIHRPYDGGVQLGTGGPQHGAQAIRMSKKYIRYQSGKGIMYTTGALFAPSYDLQSLNATDVSIGSFINVITDDVDHGCQVGGIIKIQGVETSGYNGTYTIVDIVNERQFRIQAQSVLSNVYATLGPNAKMSLVSWHGATVRAGAFDEQNGMFWQYDGRTLAVGLRSATFQIAGTIDIAKDTNLVSGTNTRFRDQLKAGDKIVIKGMTHTVNSISSQISMTVTPDYRGATDAVASKLCLIRDQIIPQNKFNLDRLDGTGESGYNVDISTMQMIGLQYTWYGAGFIDFMLRGSDGNYVFAHRIRNSNVNTEAYMRTGNLPVRYEVINESAIGKLAESVTATQATIPLLDAADFPNESGVVYIDNEFIAFTGKTSNTLTGCTRTAPLTNFVGGSQRTFRAGSATTHEYNTGVVLVSNTISPIVSHWGSAFLTDGRFDEDRGYIFSYASTGISVTTTKQTAFLIRLAPSVSNAIVGDLGERELLNRAQLLLKAIELTSETGTGGIVVEGVLNPSNYPTDPSLISWSGLQGLASGGQPSFAQIAPGGSVTWSGTGQTTGTATTTANINGNLTVPNLTVFNRSSGTNFFYATQTSWTSINAQTGFLINDAKYPSGTTISSITASSSPVANTLNLLSSSANVYNGNSSQSFSAGATTIWFQKNSWESLVGTTAPTQVQGLRPQTGFPSTAFVTSVGSLVSLGGGASNQYYPVNFNTGCTSTINAGNSITFNLGGSYTNNLNNLYFTTASWTALPIDVPRVGTQTNDGRFVGGTSITVISSTRNFAGTSYIAVTFSNSASSITGNASITFNNIPYYQVFTSANSTSAVNANATVQLTLQQNTSLTNFVYVTRASWETLVTNNSAGIGTEVSDAKFPANTRISSVSALQTFSSTQYYRLTFNQTSISTITATVTITFRFGTPPYALPGETVFSFIAQPGSLASSDLGELKELTNTTLGGRGTYPNGPDVLAINVYKVSGTGISSNVILRWGEAQA